MSFEMATDGIKLFSDDQVTKVDTQLDTNQLYDLDLQDAGAFRSFFEFERIVRWVQAAEHRRVALQLPDGLLKHAYRLSSALEAECGDTKFFVLADTSYRSCCVDDVAAQHAICDALVHFGEACLSSTTRRIPVLFVFGRFPISAEEFRQKVREYVEKNELAGSEIFLVYDSVFAHCADELRSILEAELPADCSLVACDVVGEGEPTDEAAEIKLGRRVPSALSQSSDRTRRLFFVGTEGSPLLSIWCMTFTSLSEFAHFAPETHLLTTGNTFSHRQLRKRLFLVEKLRDANVVGLVVGTLDIAGYREAIQRVRALCKAANKKLYVFSIGKLNEAKLSNFAGDIDVFVLLSCPFGIVLDSSDFYKPLVSMFEAEIALNSGREWFAGDGWRAEFAAFLSDSITAVDEEKADVSLITGRVRGIQVVEGEAEGAEGANRQVVEYSAGDYFANRSWKGLNDEHHEEDEDDKTLKEGLKGVGIGYTSESRS